MLWYDLHSNPYIYYTCSKLILFNTHNKCLGLYASVSKGLKITLEILPKHCAAGSVKGLLQVYEENMRLGKTT